MIDGHTLSSSHRVSTGIPGLDTILQGGLRRGSIYLVMGPPGAGKTILCNQMCFHQAATGDRAVYVSLLAETHGHLLSHLRSLDFFTEDPIGTSMFYYSGYAALEEDGLEGLLKLLQAIMRDHRPALLVLDSMTATSILAKSEVALKRFIQQLQTWGEVYGCTTLLIKLAQPSTFDSEHTMVDGIIELSDHNIGLRAVRQFQVRKFRGSAYLRGSHLFDITQAGLIIHPRTETVLNGSPAMALSDVRLTFGVPALDEMVGGGVFSGSTTALLGVPGSGKTLLSLAFLTEGARHGESGAYFSFGETPVELIASARRIGLPIELYVTNGTLNFFWRPAASHLLDELTAEILETVERQQVRRLVIDGLDGLRDTSIYPERFAPALAALVHRLRALGVTTVGSVEMIDLFGPAIQVPLESAVGICDNIVFLRQVEHHSQLYRLISILKMRGSSHSRVVREFTITDGGIDVAETFASAEAILTGVARPLPEGPLA